MGMLAAIHTLPLSDHDFWPLWGETGKNGKSMTEWIIYHYIAQHVNMWQCDLNWSSRAKQRESHLTLATLHFLMHQFYLLNYLCITEIILISFVFCEASLRDLRHERRVSLRALMCCDLCVWLQAAFPTRRGLWKRNLPSGRLRRYAAQRHGRCALNWVHAPPSGTITRYSHLSTCNITYKKHCHCDTEFLVQVQPNLFYLRSNAVSLMAPW